MYNYANLPERWHGPMKRYIDHGILPGSFLTAVLSNDLVNAMGQADNQSLEELYNIVCWVYNEIPSESWGSPQKVAYWITARQREIREHAEV